jgi:fructan beta-fructosidase
LPRELSLTSSESGVRILQKVVSEIDSIRNGSEVYQELTIESNQPALFNLFSPLNEMNIEFEEQTSNSFGFVFQNSDDEKVVIRYDVEKELLSIDRTNAGDNRFSESFPTVQEASVKMENNRIKLQIFLDASSIEVLANDGKVVFTSLIFPNQPYEQMVLFSEEGYTKVSSLTVTELDSIWGK